LSKKESAVTVTHVGATKSYVSGWESIFTKGSAGRARPGSKGKTKAASKPKARAVAVKKAKPAAKPSAKKASGGKKSKSR
jgi:hypothetical protein